MNKIINWVGGSFFRTIGRLLVYILLGFLLSIILSKYDITGLFNILDVHADADISGTNFSQQSIYVGPSTSQTRLNFSTYTEKNINGRPFLYNSSNFTTSSLYGSWWTLGTNQDLTKYNILNFKIYTTNLIPSSVTIRFRGGTSFSDASYISDELSCYFTQLSNYTLIDSNDINTTTQTYSTAYIYDIKCNVNIKTNYDYYVIFIYSSYASSFSYNGSGGNVISPTIGISRWFAFDKVIDNSVINSSIEEQTNQQQENHEETMNTITDDNTSGASDSASNFFSNFSTNQHGLTGIITAPLTAIQSLTSQTCSPLVLPLPFVNQNLTLPCMRTIYDQHFGAFMQLYDIITLGIISYWVMVRIFALVKDFKNPEHDEIEVVDL